MLLITDICDKFIPNLRTGTKKRNKLIHVLFIRTLIKVKSWKEEILIPGLLKNKLSIFFYVLKFANIKTKIKKKPKFFLSLF